MLSNNARSALSQSEERVGVSVSVVVVAMPNCAVAVPNCSACVVLRCIVLS